VFLFVRKSCSIDHPVVYSDVVEVRESSGMNRETSKNDKKRNLKGYAQGEDITMMVDEINSEMIHNIDVQNTIIDGEEQQEAAMYEYRLPVSLQEKLEENEVKRIIGGTVSEKDRYGYQVGLMIDTWDRAFCGGTLISKDWVLSAAHCGGYATRVQIGRHNYTDDTEEYEEIRVLKEINHPEYNRFSNDYDFMLLQLENPSNYTPVKLAKDDTDESKMKRQDPLTTIGWGVTSVGGTLSDILLEVEVGYFPNLLCSVPYMIMGGITRSMLCARAYKKDACQGDSGGPLVERGEDASSDVQVGIVSWGIGCAFLLFPGVYSRVSEGISFIETYVTDLR
jgi:trypsin